MFCVVSFLFCANEKTSVFLKIEEEEKIAIEIAKIDEESNRLINGPKEFGGLRKALIGSITGFKNLVMSEKT